MIREVWQKIEIPRSTHLALVLDTSDSAHLLWKNILALVYELLNAIPGALQSSIYFLGDAKPYSTQEFQRHHARLYQENFSRASLLTPLLEALEHSDESLIIVLAAGRIFDLEDWLDTAIVKRVVFVTFGEISPTDKKLPEYLPEVDEILRSEPLRLRIEGPRRVDIHGRGAFPFFWNNDSYRLESLTLSAQQADIWAVCVGFLCATDDMPVAEAVVSGNQLHSLTMLPCSSQPSEENWLDLMPDEETVYRQAISADKYLCPLCHREHTVHTLRCPNQGRLLGQFVYSSLAHLQGKGFVLLADSRGKVRARSHACQALRVSEQSVAVRRGGVADIYDLCLESRAWQKSGRLLRPYQPIWGGTHAIIL